MKHALLVVLALLIGPSIGPLSAQQAAPNPDQAFITEVRAFIAKGDFASGEQRVRQFQKAQGWTPAALEALSWLGRGQLAKSNLDEALRFAYETESLALDALKSRELDAEARLPIALGAAIEVQGQAMAAKGDLADAIRLLQKNYELYKTTSMQMRIQKNIHLLTLEGKPAPSFATAEYIGARPPQISDLKGKAVLLFFWAHWCPDCKAMIPVLAGLQDAYRDQGLVIVGPTQRFGYVARRAPADRATETKYIAEIRKELYGTIDMSVPVSEESYAGYGTSTTPTIVLVGRDGIVTLYHPGQMTREQLEPEIRKALATGSR
jgi:thiol-disulfide isomerase/thioredoxin